jgi:hypothetical protein
VCTRVCTHLRLYLSLEKNQHCSTPFSCGLAQLKYQLIVTKYTDKIEACALSKLGLITNMVLNNLLLSLVHEFLRKCFLCDET